MATARWAMTRSVELQSGHLPVLDCHVCQGIPHAELALR